MLADVPIRGVRDRVYLLKSLPAFAPLDEESLTLMAEHARVRSFKKGDALLLESEPIRAVYLILEGTARVTYQGELVAVGSRGVGLLAVMSGQDSGSGATALDDITALEIPTEAILAAYEESFSIVRNALRLCAIQLVKSRGNLPAKPDPTRVIDEGVAYDRPRTLVERVIEARKAPLMKRANLDAVVEMVRRGREVRYEAGRTLWSVSEPSDFQIRIDCGRVRCTAADGQTVDIGSAFILGSLDCIATLPRSYDAVAVKSIIAFRTDIQSWLSVMETHHDLARGLLSILATVLLDEQRAAHRAERLGSEKDAAE